MDTTYAPHGWKKAVLVISSVLMILAALFYVLLGLASALMTGSSELAEGFQQSMAGTSIGLFAGGLSGPDLLLVVAAFLLASGFFDLLCGIFGIRAARGRMVVTPYLVMAAISLAVAVVSFATDLWLGSATLDPSSLAGSFVLPVVSTLVGLLVWREERAA
jgi:hypothetical protein